MPEGTATPGNSNDYKTIYTYYPNSGLVQSKTTPLGRSTTFTYTKDQKVLTKTDPGGNVTNYAYYTDGRIWKITSPAPVSAVTQYKYDNAGRPTQIIDPTGVSSKTVYSTATGLPTAVIGPRGTAAGANQATIDAATTTLSYGKDGQLTQESTPNPGGAGSITTSYTYDPYTGQPATVTDPMGLTTKYLYDRVGTGIGMIENSQGANATTTLLSHDYAGRTVGEISPGQADKATPKDVETTYDNAGHITQVLDELDRKTTYTYDNVGRLATMVTPRGYDAGASAADYTWTYNYNANGWPTGVKNPLNKSTVIGYDEDGRKTSFTNRNNVVSRTWAYYTSGSNTGRVCYIKASDGGISGFDYDTNGRRTKSVQPDVDGTRNQAGSVTCPNLDFTDAAVTSYDAAGRVTGYDPPVLAATTKNYEAATGWLQSATDSGGASVTYTRDALGRPTLADYSGTVTPDISYSYNKDSQPLTANNGVTAGSYTFTYSPEDGTLSTVALGSDSYTYGYTKNGQINARTRPGAGGADSYTYDAAGQLTAITNNSSTFPTFNYDYDSNGNIKSFRVDANFWRQDYTYDKADRLSTIEDFNGNSLPASNSLLRRDITRDDVGNPTLIKTVRNSTTEYAAYSYDTENRLQGVCYGTTAPSCTAPTSNSEWFTYDKAGNRKTSKLNNGTATNYTYNDANQLLTAGAATLTYNSAGNMTTDNTGRTYTYDAANRPITTKSTGASTADKYIYDALGNRQQIQYAGSTTNTETFSCGLDPLWWTRVSRRLPRVRTLLVNGIRAAA